MNRPRSTKQPHGSGLKDLAALRDALRQRERDAAQMTARVKAAQVAADAAHRQFASAVGPVTPLRRHTHADIRRPPPPPEPLQRQADERAALREALSDEVDVESLLLTDDGLSFRRPGVSTDVVTRLRRGQWAIQGQIDLHGLRSDEARDELAAFVRDTARRGERCVRVVHGKGNGSPGRQPVLKGKVQRWLAQCRDVMAFAQASGPQGGAGALIVLLAGNVQQHMTTGPERRLPTGQMDAADTALPARQRALQAAPGRWPGPSSGIKGPADP